MWTPRKVYAILLAQGGTSPVSPLSDGRNTVPRRAGRHFLQIPGPSNVPDRILRAIDNATIDHRGPEFGQLGREVLAGLKAIFRTEGQVVIYPASGTGAWEAALVNTLSPGDRVLMFETGQFAALWRELAGRLRGGIHFVSGGLRPCAASQRLVPQRRAGTARR